MNDTLNETAMLLARLESLRQLHRRLCKVNHPNRDAWINSVARMGRETQRQIDSNIQKLHWGVFNVRHN